MDKSISSIALTLQHIARVNELLTFCAKDLLRRGKEHDESKLHSPEKELFDEMTPLKHLEYGSDEYKEALEKLKPALDHHYLMNDHHPEYFENGMEDMNLLQLIELCVDWKASSERHTTGDIEKSMKINKERFGISDQLEKILLNTLKLF